MSHENFATAGAQGIWRTQRIAADDPARLKDRLAGSDEDVERLRLKDQEGLQPGEAPCGLVVASGLVRLVDAHELTRGLAAGNHSRGSGIENVQIVQSAGATENAHLFAQQVHEL